MGIVKEAAVWMSGHSTDRCDKSYFSSLSTPAMKYNAGFFDTPKETYYIPIARIVLPEAEGQIWLRKIGPFMGTFRKSVERTGDKYVYAEIYFMNELLPYFLLVALQDGAFLVGYVKYQDTPWAMFLVDLLGPSHEEWAVEKYAWARIREAI
jgi:hypothetical protein